MANNQEAMQCNAMHVALAQQTHFVKCATNVRQSEEDDEGKTEATDQRVQA